MSEGRIPAVSGAKGAANARRRPNGGRALIVIVIFLLCVLFLVELIFQPLHSMLFLRLAGNVKSYEPYAYAPGSITAIWFAWEVWSSRNLPQNRGEYDGAFGEIKLFVLLLFAPVVGFWVGWSLITFCLPLVQHQFAAKTQVEYPFTITGFAFGKPCRGMKAVNSLFFDDRLCGVWPPGHSSEWEGRTIIVTGRQSRYGMTVDQYRLDERTPATSSLPSVPGANVRL